MGQYGRPNLALAGLLVVHVACGRGSALQYVMLLPVLWMTSCFHTMEPVGHNQARRYVRVHRVAVPVGRQTTTQCLVEFVGVWHRGSAVYDCLVQVL